MAWAGASTVVCLNPVEELVVRYPEYVDWLRANRGGRAIWFPIENFHAPVGAVGDTDPADDHGTARGR